MVSPTSSPGSLTSPSTLPATQRRRRAWRLFKDTAARHLVGIGGIGVIIAILLIFFYLIYVVIPLFKSATAELTHRFPAPGGGETLKMALEEQAEIGVRYTSDGRAVFFDTVKGNVIQNTVLTLPEKSAVTSFGAGAPSSNFAVFGLSNGQAIAVKSSFTSTYTDGKRQIVPKLEYPLGEAALTIDRSGHALTRIVGQHEGDKTTLVATTDDNRLLLTSFEREEAMLGEEGALVAVTHELPRPDSAIEHILLDPAQRRLYTLDHFGFLTYLDISDKNKPRVVHRLNIADNGSQITALEFLSGGISLLVGNSNGTITQWFPVRDEHGNELLTAIRSFKERNAPITRIAPEYFRKGFVTADAAGYIGIYHATAHRTLLVAPASTTALKRIAISPRANALLIEDANGQVAFWRVANDYPEVSWSSLWGKVWYESYDKPQWLWQSSASTNVFEPKFSFTPLAFGTLKAAFYAMLVAVPLSLLGAIYTAHFMSPRMRGIVKPTIEIMGAVPTVVLGFLAGLWLAPAVEKLLPGVFSAMLVMPIGVIAFAYFWHRLPAGIRGLVPEGWYGALLIPVVLALAWGSLALSPYMELWWFDGNMRLWLSQELGISFDQRNSIIVGLAMGFAVTPIIFTITEDAIFSVPRHLVNGSLALGATPWQTMWRVVLLTASPGIFSATMIGLGRAVGETMIVLMATGNTPVMDLSIFQGMRTLSANIAVEMPESELGSTHYRLLFLAALVLFMFTFAVNTVAEMVRQRLRRKYSSL